MAKSFLLRSVLAALALVALAPMASAQLVPGDALPSADVTFETADGARLRLADTAGEGGLVVLFWSNACPWADKYAARVASLVEGYLPAGIGMVLVNANDAVANERENAAASRQKAADAGLSVPYVLDTTGDLARAFGARNAPQAFFFGPARTLLYLGAIDDSPADPLRVTTPYLQRAMDQSIAGLPVEVQQTQAFGCTLKPAGARP